MSDHYEKTLQARFELANEISRVKQELLNVAIAGLFVLREQNNHIAIKTLEEMKSCIPEELEGDIFKELDETLGTKE